MSRIVRPTGASDRCPGRVPAPRDGAVMRWLAAGVPLALLADLALPGGPDSREILRREGLPGLARSGPELPSPA